MTLKKITPLSFQEVITAVCSICPSRPSFKVSYKDDEGLPVVKYYCTNHIRDRVVDERTAVFYCDLCSRPAKDTHVVEQLEHGRAGTFIRVCDDCQPIVAANNQKLIGQLFAEGQHVEVKPKDLNWSNNSVDIPDDMEGLF